MDKGLRCNVITFMTVLSSVVRLLGLLFPLLLGACATDFQGGSSGGYAPLSAQPAMPDNVPALRRYEQRD